MIELSGIIPARDEQVLMVIRIGAQSIACRTFELRINHQLSQRKELGTNSIFLATGEHVKYVCLLTKSDYANSASMHMFVLSS